MKIERPEYLGLMMLHVARWHLEKALEKPYNRDAMHKLRPVLPYCIHTDGDSLPGVVNRIYSPLGCADSDWTVREEYPQFRFPKCNLWTAKPTRTWLFNDGNPPWKNRACAERYLAALELLVDFTLPEPPAQGVGQ